MRLDDDTDGRRHVPGSGFSIHLIGGMRGSIQAMPRTALAENLNRAARLSHLARLRQSQSHDRIDRHECVATLVPANLRNRRRTLAPFSCCGVPRMDIGRTEVYGFHLARDEDEAHPKPLYRHLHDGRRPGLVPWMRPHRR
jgi:hypothetical protein